MVESGVLIWTLVLELQAVIVDNKITPNTRQKVFLISLTPVGFNHFDSLVQQPCIPRQPVWLL
jgi:hypothetical protein